MNRALVAELGQLRRELRRNPSLFAMTVPGVLVLLAFAYLPMPGLRRHTRDGEAAPGGAYADRDASHG